MLEGEEARRDAQKAEVLFPDDLLPGVGGKQTTLKEGLRKGGFQTFVVLLALNSLDELENSAVAILGPDIGRSFGVSDGTVTAISTASLMFFVLGAGPMGWLADRFRRGPIVGIASGAFAAFSALSGAAVNALMFFFMRFFAGMSKANTITVHPSLLADTYPLQTRGRMYATNAGVGRIFSAISPVLAGGIAVWIGGDDGWRWSFYLLGLPTAALAFLAFFLREPPRGQWEQKHVLGAGLKQDNKMPISVEAAFTRIWNIDTIRNMTIAFAAMGFALFPAGSIQSFFLEEEFELDALGRGLAVAPAGVGLLLLLPYVGRRFRRHFPKGPRSGGPAHRHPPAADRRAGCPSNTPCPTLPCFMILSAINSTFLGGAFAMVQPTMQSVFPYRLRGMGTAFLTFFMVMVGGVGGSIIAGFLQDELGEQIAITIITATAMPIGAYFVLRGASRPAARSLAGRWRAEGRTRRRTPPSRDRPRRHARHPGGPRGLQLRAGAGAVRSRIRGAQAGDPGPFGHQRCGQVHRAQSDHRAGNPGAGSGAPARQKPSPSPHPNSGQPWGCTCCPGGAGVWSDLSIRDNLLMGAYAYRRDASDRDRRIEKVLDMFPDLARRPNERAGNLSGGQQQMLALARVMLHEPEVLMIDELSLGLAPVVVQSLLETVEGLKDQGQTMIIVEQSLNVALAIADRAVFLEKGQVRFEGPAQELAERDDLARAVFLGTEARLMDIASGFCDRDLDHPAIGVQWNSQRLGDRAGGPGNSADLPVHAGHQLRGREYGHHLRLDDGAAGAELRMGILAGTGALAGAGGVVRRGGGADCDSPTVQLSPGDRACCHRWHRPAGSAGDLPATRHRGRRSEISGGGWLSVGRGLVHRDPGCGVPS